VDGQTKTTYKWTNRETIDEQNDKGLGKWTDRQTDLEDNQLNVVLILTNQLVLISLNVTDNLTQPKLT
jgi:hypothetical protein